MNYGKKGEPALQNGVPRLTAADALGELAAELNAEQYSRLIAIVSGDPPPGWTRWTMSLLAEEMVRRGIVARISPDELRRAIEKATLYRFLPPV